MVITGSNKLLKQLQNKKISRSKYTKEHTFDEDYDSLDELVQLNRELK